MSEWTIEFHQRSIVGGTHNFWALRGRDGRVVREMHGFATRPDGSKKPVGFPWQADDYIGMYDISRDQLNAGEFREVLGRNFDAEHVVEPHSEAFRGSKEEAERIWRRGARIAQQVNAAKIDYRLVEFFDPAINSNAVAYTFGVAAGLKADPLKDPRSGKSIYNPGWGRDLREALMKRNEEHKMKLRRRALDHDLAP